MSNIVPMMFLNSLETFLESENMFKVFCEPILRTEQPHRLTKKSIQVERTKKNRKKHEKSIFHNILSNIVPMNQMFLNSLLLFFWPYMASGTKSAAGCWSYKSTRQHV